MNPFRVWVRSLGTTSRVRVEGSENAQWLLGRLAKSYVFKSSEPCRDESDSSSCTFQVLHNSQCPRSAFDKVLATIPEITVMLTPA